MAGVWGRKAGIIVLSSLWAGSSQIKYDPLSVFLRASSRVTSNPWPLFKNWTLRERQTLIETVCHFFSNTAVLARNPPCWEKWWTYPWIKTLLGSSFTFNTHFYYQHQLHLVCFTRLGCLLSPNCLHIYSPWYLCVLYVQVTICLKFYN